MNETIKIVTDIWDIVSHSPIWLIILIVLNLLGVWLQWSSFCPNRIIPIILAIGGLILNCLLGSITEISVTQRHPNVVLALLGIILGALAFGLHTTLVQWLWHKFGVQDQDTQQTRKLDDPPKQP